MSDAHDLCPAPLDAGDTALFHATVARTGDVKLGLEDLLEAVPRTRSDPLMLLLREGRGSWLFDLASSAESVLFCGSALSGTIIALARTGLDVTIVDDCAERLAFCAARVPRLSERKIQVVRAAAESLPFPDHGFDVVIGEVDVSRAVLAEYRRVAKNEIVITCENRLAYKRSAGRRGIFHVPSPFEFVRRALWPKNDARTLAGHRRALSWPIARALALYPHGAEFAQLAALDGGLPRLFVGPRERENKLKVAAQKVGLFPWLTPSFALIARRANTQEESRAERLLAALAERVGEDVPEIEHAIATRGNALLWQTKARDDQTGDDPRGRWSVKLPLGLHRQRLAARNFERLVLLRQRFPALPLPEPLFAGSIAGAFVTCERRLPGMSAAQTPDDPSNWARTLRQAAEQLAGLVVEKERILDDATLSVLIDEKAELVLRHVRDKATRKTLAELHMDVRTQLAGRTLPLVVQHADLRPKHVQVDAHGHIAGYLDWGSSLLADLPYFDLAHLLGQARKQSEDAAPGRAWQVVQSSADLHPAEREAVDVYAERTGLDQQARRALERFYPMLVASQAERTWDYSRPSWVHTHYFAD